ncbi:MAG: RlpA-like protein precursor [Bacteroidota bacterium]|nr:RlpA-like protein precursor [Bacteroidota bacterium]
MITKLSDTACVLPYEDSLLSHNYQSFGFFWQHLCSNQSIHLIHRILKAKQLILFITLYISSINLYSQQDSVAAGKASYYAHKFEGRKTASGEKFSNKKLTAAHKTLPFGTRVKVTNKRNDKSVIVTINDRLPKKSKRLIDLSQAAAKELDLIRAGITTVQLYVLND